MNEESLFAAASALPAGPERDSFLDRECASDLILRARLKQLLDAQDVHAGILDRDGLSERTVIGLTPKLTQLDEYELLEEIGRGGMGVVYRARHRSLHKLVAVKVLLGAVLDDGAKQRIRVEMAALGRLKHPNLLQAFDAREIDGQPLIVTELLDGVSLDKLLERTRRFPVATACDYIRQAACGLAAAHEQNLIHRDIKPANMMLDPSTENLKLLDFGLALLVRPESVELHGPTLPGQALGTPHFMPPEQWRDSHLVCEKSDIYSLGITLYCLLTGKPPFERRTLIELMHAHCFAPRPQIPGLDPELNQLLLAMLHVDPAQRPSAMDVVRELDRYCVGPVPSLLPPLIDTLEKHGIAGRIGPEIERVKGYLQRLPRHRVVNLFREAGVYLGRKGLVDGAERGLAALIQIFLETGDDNEAFELGVAVLKEAPECFDALHLTAVAARQSAFSYGGDPETRLREAVRLELAAQQTPSASSHPNLGPSLSVLAQIYHNLAKHYRSRDEDQSARTALQQALECFRRRLKLQETALGLALYAEALVDAGDLKAARDAAARACELDWFLREAQQLVLRLAGQRGERLDPTEEHFRQWSLVAGEWPGSPMHRSHLTAYRTYLQKSRLWPEMMAWEAETPAALDPVLQSKVSQAARGTVERTIHFETGTTQAGGRPRQLVYHAMIWQFHEAKSCVVAGIPFIRVFGVGDDQESAISDLESLLFMIQERVVKSRQPQTPLIVTLKCWFSERIN